MSTASLTHLSVEALNAARRWAISRVTLRRVLDSKSSSPALAETAKREYQKNTDILERSVMLLEAHLAESGSRLSAKAKKAPGTSKPLPWKSILGAIAAGANALENAVSDQVGAANAVGGVVDDFIRAEVVDPPAGKKK